MFLPLDQALDSQIKWTFVRLNLSYPEIVDRKIIKWCTSNIPSYWCIKNQCTFGFENPGDALIFKIQFDS